MNFKVKDNKILINILATNDGKFQFKMRETNLDFGEIFATRSKNFNEKIYLEWQLGYDAIVSDVKAGKKETGLKKFSFIGDNKKEKYPVEMDAYSSHLNLAYEFVAVDDYYKFGGEISGSTAQSYDVIKAAENLREKMKKYGKINTVIFYDPLVNRDREVPKNESYDALKYSSYGFGDKKNKKPHPRQRCGWGFYILQ